MEQITAVIFGFFVVAVWCLQPICGYIETVEEYGCQDNEFRLTCRHLDSHIAILEATFFPDDPAGNASCSTYANGTAGPNATDFSNNVTDSSAADQITTATNQFHQPTAIVVYSNNNNVRQNRNIRLSLNKRCSGMSHCRFILLENCPGANKWGPGLVAFKYACFAARRVTKFCNMDIILNGTNNEGFVQSPGYPGFYVGDTACRWNLTAPWGQRVQIILLDVSLRGIGPFETGCTDELSITDEGRSMLVTCEERPMMESFLSTGQTLEIVITSRSRTAFPKRGILFYYKALGCPTLPAPADGYLNWRNETIAEYVCCVNHTFPDTQMRMRTLRCLHQNTWSPSTVPDCVRNNTEAYIVKSITENINFLPEKPRQKAAKMYNETSTLYDVIIPTAIIAALFIINAIVVLIIYKYRKRKLLTMQEEEMAVISAEENSTVIS